MIAELQPIKYFLLANGTNLSKIGEYPQTKYPEEISKEAFKIFKKYCSTSLKSPELKGKINNEEGKYLFILSVDDIFYILYAINELNDKEAFNLINEIREKHIYLMTDPDGVLNSIGKVELNKIFLSFEEKYRKKVDEELHPIKNIGSTTKNVVEKFTKVGSPINCKWTSLLLIFMIFFMLIVFCLTVPKEKES